MARIAQGGPSLWKKKKATIAASGTNDIFSMNSGEFRGYIAHISIYDSTNDKLANFTYQVSKKNSAIVDTVYGKIGDVLSYAITTVVVGPNVVTTLTNNESLAIQVSFYSLKLI